LGFFLVEVLGLFDFLALLAELFFAGGRLGFAEFTPFG